MTYQAAAELERIKSLSAFNVEGARRQRLNQHSSLYHFPDNSTLQINATAGLGFAWHNDYLAAYGSDMSPVHNVPLRINRQS